MTSNPWDSVADKFNTYKDEIWFGAAENIETVWPVILDYIKQHYPNAHGLKALDFGCGTGMFCRELSSKGFSTAGIDISPEMIKIGKEHLNKNIELYLGDADFAKSFAQQEGGFNLVTAIMVLQFIDERQLKQLAATVKPTGHIIFANFNPHYMEARGMKDTFTLSDSQTTVPIYKRSPQDYDDIFLPLGFKSLLEVYPSDSEAFLEKHKLEKAPADSKYLILAYQKK